MDDRVLNRWMLDVFFKCNIIEVSVTLIYFVQFQVYEKLAELLTKWGKFIFLIIESFTFRNSGGKPEHWTAVCRAPTGKQSKWISATEL